MGFGTVFATLTFLLIFAGMVVVVTGVQKGLANSAVQMNKAQAMAIVAQQEGISILSSSYGYGALSYWRVTYADGFNLGTFNNTTVVADQVQLTANGTGTYTSEAYDTGFTSNYTTLSWSALQPGTSTVTFQVRSANSTTALNATPFTGPDGTTATNYSVSGSTLNATLSQNRYVQYRATFTSAAGSDPILYDVTLGVKREAGDVNLTIKNTGQSILHFEDTDTYVDGVRVLRDDAHRVLQEQIITNPRLWDPGEELNVTIFTTISAPTTVMAVNDYAKDQVIVT